MKTAEQMHAIVRRKYGTPDVLAYEVIERLFLGMTTCWWKCTQQARASARILLSPTSRS
jgi:hypothetical protein